MHIRQADERRRQGRTSWDEYGWEASAADGVTRLSRKIGRRDSDGRLLSLRGLYLADLQALYSPATLGEIELTLTELAAGMIQPDQAQARLRELFREVVHLLQEPEVSIREAASEWVRALEREGKITSAEASKRLETIASLPEPGSMVDSYREHWHQELEIGDAGRGYPRTEAMLERLRRSGELGAEREFPMTEAYLEEVVLGHFFH
jgi:hypothetical protein